jgi:hypothetical protein
VIAEFGDQVADTVDVAATSALVDGEDEHSSRLEPGNLPVKTHNLTSCVQG